MILLRLYQPTSPPGVCPKCGGDLFDLVDSAAERNSPRGYEWSRCNSHAHHKVCDNRETCGYEEIVDVVLP